MRVLIVEDDPELAGLLRDGLRAQRIDPTLAATFAAGRERAALSTYDVIVLDVRLPGGTGFELCRELRRGGVTTQDRKSTRLNSSHGYISYAVFCLKKKKTYSRTYRHDNK